MKVLISIPAYNEEKTIGNIINETKSYDNIRSLYFSRKITESIFKYPTA